MSDFNQFCINVAKRTIGLPAGPIRELGLDLSSKTANDIGYAGLRLYAGESAFVGLREKYDKQLAYNALHDFRNLVNDLNAKLKDYSNKLNLYYQSLRHSPSLWKEVLLAWATLSAGDPDLKAWKTSITAKYNKAKELCDRCGITAEYLPTPPEWNVPPSPGGVGSSVIFTPRVQKTQDVWNDYKAAAAENIRNVLSFCGEYSALPDYQKPQRWEYYHRNIVNNLNDAISIIEGLLAVDQVLINLGIPHDYEVD